MQHFKSCLTQQSVFMTIFTTWRCLTFLIQSVSEYCRGGVLRETSCTRGCLQVGTADIVQINGNHIQFIWTVVFRLRRGFKCKHPHRFHPRAVSACPVPLLLVSLEAQRAWSDERPGGAGRTVREPRSCQRAMSDFRLRLWIEATERSRGRESRDAIPPPGAPGQDSQPGCCSTMATPSHPLVSDWTFWHVTQTGATQWMMRCVSLSLSRTHTHFGCLEKAAYKSTHIHTRQ